MSFSMLFSPIITPPPYLSVFDDKVGCYSSIVHCIYHLAAEAEPKRSEEHCDSKRALPKRSAHVQELGLSLFGSLQSQKPNKMEDL